MPSSTQRFLAAAAFTIALALIGTTARAQTYHYLTALNQDGDPGTGCTLRIIGNNGMNTMAGVDHLLRATVTDGQLASIQTATCATGTIDSANINTTLNWQPDTAHPTYTLSGAFIEYRLPANAAINPGSTIGFASSTDIGFATPPTTNVIFTIGGNPISLAPLLTRAAGGVSIPGTSPIILLLIALTLGILGAGVLRHPKAHRLGLLILFLGAITLSGAGYSALRIALDGTGAGWDNATLLASDAIGDVTPEEIDLTHAYGALQDNRLHLKLHIHKQPQTQTPVPAVAEFRLLGADITEPNDQHRITASGDQQRIRGTAQRIHIKNTTTNAQITVALSNGQWQAQIPAQAGDQIQLTPINNNDEEGGSIYVQVQGAQQQPTLPPDPINDPDVAPQLNPQDAYTVYDSTQFLYTNNPPIQVGVNPETIKPKLSSLIVGKVLNRDNTPLSGVTVTIKDHDQYGHTLTRADGQLDMVVNGGQWFTVQYTKEGYLPVQRKVQVAWQDYGYLPDVVMIPLDTKVSVIDLRELQDNGKRSTPNQKDQPETPYFQIHRGAINTDADGARQATILFPRNTEATLHMPDGSTQNLDIMNVRATEYTIGENGPNAMPGELPPATGYTYAVELSVDQAIQQGATRVQFNQPLPMYVDNFLEFPVGEIVPLGWYSYDQKAWVPDDNGRVIQVVRIDNGVAVLNVTGKEGVSTDAELAELGITIEEQKEIAKLYQAGGTFWRVRVMHFTPWDCNWPYGPPECEDGEGCEPPDEEAPEEELPPDAEDDCETGGCTIQTTSRTMIETVPVAGTPFSLTYATNRVPGYVSKTAQIRRYLRGQKRLQSSILKVEMEVRILGRQMIVFSGAPQDIRPWQIETFVWDGKDRYGRVWPSAEVVANHAVRYIQPVVYYASSSAFSRSFAQYGARTSVSQIRMGATSAAGINNWKKSILFSPYRKMNPEKTWVFDHHHFYDVNRKELYLGNGALRTENSIFSSRSVEKVFSCGTNCSIQSWDLLPTGNLVIVAYDGYRYKLFEWDIQNKKQIDWKTNSSYDIEQFKLVRVDPIHGGIYLVDTKNQIFYRSIDGDLTHLTGKSEGSVNNSVETDPFDVRFLRITNILPSRSGELYIVDQGRYCVQKRDTDGMIRTVIGECGKQGSVVAPIIEPTKIDAIKIASSSNYDNVISIAQDNSDDLYLLDRTRKQVLKIRKDGLVEPYIGLPASGTVPTTQECADQRFSADPLAFCAVPYSASFSGDGEFYFYAYAYAVNSEDSLYQVPVIYKKNNLGKIQIEAGNTDKLIGFMSGDETGAFTEVFSAFLVDLAMTGSSEISINDHDELYYQNGNNQINVISPPFTKFDGGDIAVPDASGKQLFLFDAYGNHLETRDALTGATIYRFAYDADRRLASITDHDGRITRIERNGNRETIIGPYGHRTEITLQQDGLISRLENPDGKAWQFNYDQNGLMLAATNPNGQSNRYSYDQYGRLISDIWPNGGGWTLSEEALTQTIRATTMTSGEGRKTEYHRDKDDASMRTVIRPDGSVFTQQKKYAELTKKNTSGNELVTVKSVEESDPRFGGAASYDSRVTVSFNSGYPDEYVRTRRWVELINEDTLLPVFKWGEEIYDNSSAASKAVYDHAQKAWTMTSPSGMAVKTTVDAIHRPLKVETPDRLTTYFTYDRGKLQKIEAKPETGDARVWQSAYNEQGLLAEQTDPLRRKTAFAYDAVGRVTGKTFPDGRAVRFTYDAMGNMLSLTTPANETHRFMYDAMSDASGYTSPAAPAETQSATTYQYDKERNLTRISLPGTNPIVFNRDLTTGRLTSQTYSEGARNIAYGANGKASAVTEGVNTLDILYDGPYSGGQRWAGDVNGAVNLYRGIISGYARGLVTRISAAGSQGATLYQQFSYGPDDEMTTIAFGNSSWNSGLSAITLNRDPSTLRLNSVQGWRTQDKDHRAYNGFGEIIGYDYQRRVQYEYNDYALENLEAELTGNQQPVDVLAVSGKLDANQAGRLVLIPEPHESDPPIIDYGYINVDASGQIETTDIRLPGKSGVARYYTLTGEGDNDPDRQYRIGPLTKKAPERFALHELAAIDEQYLYSVQFATPYLDEDPELCLIPLNEYGICPYHHRVIRIELATGKTDTFPIDETGAYVDGLMNAEGGGIWYESAKVIGANNGGVYVHHRYGYELCGQDAQGVPQDCVTLQGKDQAPQLIMSFPSDIDSGYYTKLALRAMEGNPGAFYAAFTHVDEDNYQTVAIVEKWQANPDHTMIQTPIIRLDDPEKIQTYLHLNNAGKDLLLGTGVIAYDSLNHYYRITPEGQTREIDIGKSDWTKQINGIFADDAHDCFLYRDYNIGPAIQRYACFDNNGRETSEGIFPYDIPDLWRIPLSPQMRQNGTLYISMNSDEDENTNWYAGPRKLWRKAAIATEDRPWEEALKDEYVITRANLAVTGGQLTATHHQIATEYGIEVERDALGRITQKTEKTQDKTTRQQYQYDDSGRLIKATADGTEHTWGYDANGNRTHQNGTEIATFDAQDRILQQNGAAYQHNPMGQRTKKTTTEGETAYRYDNLGNLREAKLPDGTEITYAIDAQDRRIGRKENGNWTHKWLYQDNLNPIAELDENDRIRKAFIYADKGNVPAYMLTFDANGNALKQYRIVSDLLGSVRVVYDLNTGNEEQRMDYDVWGNITNDTNPDLQPFGFAGGLYDQQTKLTRFGARDYDAETGRWTAKDPIGFAGGDTNLYGYVLNDPVNWVDRVGMGPEDATRIKQIYDSTVKMMDENGLRRPGSGTWNGFINNMSIPYGHSERMRCSDQAAEVLGALAVNGPNAYEYSFDSTLPSPLPPIHVWVNATPKDPNDPIITMDPWRNTYSEKYPMSEARK